MLMEHPVTLPFQEGTILLSYANNLTLAITGWGNLLTRTQEELDLISDKCKELGLKILAEKS